MTPILTREMVKQILMMLERGSRVEIAIEQGKIAIIEKKKWQKDKKV